jgi:hypothetical protein
MRRASVSWAGSTGGKSGEPESDRKHLNPATPARASGPTWAALPGMTPAQKATSTWHWPAAACRLARSASTLTVTGTLSSGMSTRVVMPPAAAARVAVAKPSHSVLPGSQTCTWESTRPGRSTSPAARSRVSRPASALVSSGSTATIVPAPRDHR